MSEIFPPNVSILSGCRANNKETTEFDFFFAQIFLSGGKTFFMLSSKKRRRGEKDNTPIHPLQIET